MDFMTAVKTCFGKYVTFSGRAQRSEFWWFVLFGCGVSMILTIIDSFLFGTITTSEYGISATSDIAIFSSIFGLIVFLPNVSVAVRRLHDTDRSGWWYWIILVPLVGFILLIVWFASKGTHGENRFGSDPLNGGGFGNDDGGDYARSRVPNVSND